MLVQSRAKACATCITKKIKCDKSAPACLQCTRGGWKCPGYTKAWKKIQVDKRRRQRYEQEWLLGQEVIVECPKQSDPNVKVATLGASQSPSPNWDNCHPSGPFPSTSPLLLHIIDHLDNSRPSGLNIGNLGSFFSYIPPRLGHSRVLDDAVQCICTAYSALLRPDESIDRQGRHEYYRALRSLRLASLDEEQVVTSNVLCAAVLLSWYEILADNINNSWITHVGGCSSLIQLRGPARHQTGFDHALLRAEEGSISIIALLKRKPCFLNSQSWQTTLNSEKISSNSCFLTNGTPKSSVAQLSTLLCSFDQFHLIPEAEAEQSILAICSLYHKIRLRLQRSLAQQKREIHIPILRCKDSNYLLLIDTALLKVLESQPRLSPLSNTIQRTYLQNFSTQFTYMPYSSLRDLLEDQITKHFEIFRENLLLASTQTPLNVRKMSFLCKIACEERRKREENPHPVWSLFELCIERVIDQNWLKIATIRQTNIDCI